VKLLFQNKINPMLIILNIHTANPVLSFFTGNLIDKGVGWEQNKPFLDKLFPKQYHQKAFSKPCSFSFGNCKTHEIKDTNGQELTLWPSL